MTNEQIDQCLRKHLLDDKRTDVKTSALAEVMDWLTHGSTLVDETRAVFVLPVWKQLIEVGKRGEMIFFLFVCFLFKNCVISRC